MNTKRDRLRIEVDIDGTIFEESSDRTRVVQKENAVAKINSLHEAGHIIIIRSSRSWSEFQTTEAQLLKAGVNYDILVLGKISADIIIDDRAALFSGEWDNSFMNQLDVSVSRKMQEPRWKR
jgi:hydroxymethylpyrimidine pyrophosphatase-like HAD family hydrolase